MQLKVVLGLYRFGPLKMLQEELFSGMRNTTRLKSPLYFYFLLLFFNSSKLIKERGIQWCQNLVGDSSNIEPRRKTRPCGCLGFFQTQHLKKGPC